MSPKGVIPIRAKRLLGALLSAALAVTPTMAMAAASDSVQQALQDQAAMAPVSNGRIDYAIFPQSEIYMGPSEPVDLTVQMQDLIPGSQYTVTAMLTGSSGGYVASGLDQPQADETFAADASMYETTLHFRLNSVSCPGEHWTAVVVLSDSTGAVLDTYKDSIIPIEVVEPQIDADVSQNDIDGTVMVSMIATVTNITPDDDYVLVGSLTKEQTTGPYILGGKELTASVPLNYTSENQQYGVPASAEVLLEVAASEADMTPLIPVVSVLKDGEVISQKRSAKLVLGAAPTWAPQQDAVFTAEPTAEPDMTDEPVPTSDPGDDIAEDFLDQELQADEEILGTEGQQAENSANLRWLIICGCAVGGAAAAALMMWRRYRKNSRPW